MIIREIPRITFARKRSRRSINREMHEELVSESIKIQLLRNGMRAYQMFELLAQSINVTLARTRNKRTLDCVIIQQTSLNNND